MALSRTAKYYRKNKKARAKHNASSKKWNKTSKGKKYKKEYNKKTSDKTASRIKARRKMIKSGKLKEGSKKHVDHKNRNANDNRSSNLRVTSAKFNLRRNKKR